MKASNKWKILLCYYSGLYFIYVILSKMPPDAIIWKWFFPIKLILFITAYVWASVHIGLQELLLYKKNMASDDTLELKRRTYILKNTFLFLICCVLSVFVLPLIASIVWKICRIDLFFLILN